MNYWASLAIAFVMAAIASDSAARMIQCDFVNSGRELSISARRLEDGQITFRVTRDSSKARFFGRTALLRMHFKSAYREIPVKASSTDNGIVVYQFAIPPDSVSDSQFEVLEFQDGLEGGRTTVGCSQLFRIRLSEFVPLQAD